MPKENTNPEAILEAIKKVDILSELLEEKQKNNLKMIAEGKEAGGKQIGPYARLLTYARGKVVRVEVDGAETLFTFRWTPNSRFFPATTPVPGERWATCLRELVSARCRSSPASRATRRLFLRTMAATRM